jgi:hypothetical protein
MGEKLLLQLLGERQVFKTNGLFKIISTNCHLSAFSLNAFKSQQQTFTLFFLLFLNAIC